MLGLVWEANEIERDKALNDDFVTLDLVQKQCVGDAPWRNLIIEGDNYDALRYLRMAFAGHVKCILIDPPYNTGNDDFIYNDRFVSKDDSWRHSTWLEFMYRRLIVARDLLREDGVLFVHIGEDEMQRLGCLLDKVFPGRRVGTFVWRTRSGANDSKEYFRSIDHEYILCYANSEFSFSGNTKGFGSFSNPDNDKRGAWSNDNLVKAHNYKQRPQTFYPIQNPKTGVWYSCDPDNVWRFSSETKLKPGQKIRTKTIEQIINEDKILWPSDSRAAAVSQHGMLLLEAPTGAGKTLIAGHIIESFSSVEGVVWFWFAPFKGVTGQTASALRAELPGLRLRELSEDRQAADSQTGDVFVTTWQIVATKAKDNRNVHRPGEKNQTVEELLAGLRQKKLRIGVVVDEAHHGFFGSGAETQAMRFFRESLRPEYTILITATPDDADIKRFQQSLGNIRLNRITISRREPVEEGLIKEGVKCVAYFAPPEQEVLVDYEDVALRDGVALHNKLKEELKKLRVDLTPLMLVQVDSRDRSVERAKERLMALGFAEAQIAVHTAEEPDSTLLALANDETREVLVFKMAVALGFDAPRAFTLVSMRAARDEDFGVQLVGRILRVHRRLQARARAKSLPPALRYGYVLLADAEAQTGLDLAGQRINKLQTEYAKVSPTTAIVQMGGKAHVQVLGQDGQITLLPVTLPPGFPLPPAGTVISGQVQPRSGEDYSGFTLELLTGGYTPVDLLPDAAKPKSSGTMKRLLTCST
jgi:superfamily II DNA or RNA helicase